jgi:hypothetical protein
MELSTIVVLEVVQVLDFLENIGEHQFTEITQLGYPFHTI